MKSNEVDGVVVAVVCWSDNVEDNSGMIMLMINFVVFGAFRWPAAG